MVSRARRSSMRFALTVRACTTTSHGRRTPSSRPGGYRTQSDAMHRRIFGVAAILAATFVSTVLLAQGPAPVPAPVQAPQGRGGAPPAGGRQGGFVAYPQRPPGDPAA